MKAHHSSDAHSCGLSKAVQNLSFILNAMFSHKNLNPKTRQTHGNARKRHTTIKKQQEDKLSKATSFLFPIKMIAKLEWT